MKGTLETQPAARGMVWQKLATEVPLGGDVALEVSKDDRLVRIGVGVESGDLPLAIAGGGFHWTWWRAPDWAAPFRQTQQANANADLNFFIDAPSSIVFELAGITQSFSLSEAKRFGAYARRLQVTDVDDTDDTGTTTTVKGIYSVSLPGKPSLTWTNAAGHGSSTFSTGTAVLLWSGDYEVNVYYNVNGVTKTYAQTVHLQ